MKGTSVLNNTLIWFGAAVGIAEIMTGTYLAPLGFAKGVEAIVIGHIIGGIILFLAAYMGGKTGFTAMDTVRIGFGHLGAMFFAALNVLQLVGWTAIMIYDGAAAGQSLFSLGNVAISLILGALIFLWIWVGVEHLGKINIVAMALLFILTITLSDVIFTNNTVSAASKDMITFGNAIELAVIMPLSWLPLISDYTRIARKPLAASIGSVLGYSFGSIWMYTIGLGLALYTQEHDFVAILVKAKLSLVALLIIIFSTVTTTFMDAISAGWSLQTIVRKVNAKIVALVVTVIGAIGAILFNMDSILDFLYIIGAVFAPMSGVLIIEFYVFKRNFMAIPFQWMNLIVWAIGFASYEYFYRTGFSLGATLPSLIITMVLTLLAGYAFRSTQATAIPERGSLDAEEPVHARELD